MLSLAGFPWAATGLAVAGAAALGLCALYGCRGKRPSLRPVGLTPAHAQFAAQAAAYSGLYEPLYRISTGQMKYRPGIVGDWLTRTQHLQDAQAFQTLCAQMLEGYETWQAQQACDALTALLAFVHSAGVQRDTTLTLTVQADTYERYECAAQERIPAGTRARVTAACWYRQETVLEKGILDSIREEK